MTDELLTSLTMMLGAITVILSVVVGVKFLEMRGEFSNPDSERLSVALSLQLFGEALIGAGTLAFSVFAYMGVLPSMSIESQSSLRIAMFVATAVTSIHLYSSVKRIMRSGK